MPDDNIIRMNEMQLVKSCIEGKVQAQNQLFKQFSKQMMGVCLRYAQDYDEAQDLFQEGFVKVFQKLHMYNGKGALGAWIRRTMINNALDHIRKMKREQNNVSLFQVDYKLQSDQFDDPFEDNEPVINPKVLMELIQQMPTGYKTVFNLYAIEEYSHKEIATSLGISESTSKTQYKKAKAYLRDLIEKENKKRSE